MMKNDPEFIMKLLSPTPKNSNYSLGEFVSLKTKYFSYKSSPDIRSKFEKTMHTAR